MGGSMGVGGWVGAPYKAAWYFDLSVRGFVKWVGVCPEPHLTCEACARTRAMGFLTARADPVTE